jgi:hypothetical protein
VESCSLTKVDYFVNENHRVPIPEFSSRCLPICPDIPDRSRCAPDVSRRESLVVPFRPRFFSPSSLFQYFQRDSRWIPMEYPDGYPDVYLWIPMEYPDGYPDVYLWVPMVHLPIEFPDGNPMLPFRSRWDEVARPDPNNAKSPPSPAPTALSQ